MPSTIQAARKVNSEVIFFLISSEDIITFTTFPPVRQYLVYFVTNDSIVVAIPYIKIPRIIRWRFFGVIRPTLWDILRITDKLR